MKEIESSPSRAMFWKDEILQVLYWMDGEGLGDRVPASQILSLLKTSHANLFFHLQKMVDAGDLLCEDKPIAEHSLVRIAPEMRSEAGKRFAHAFQDLQKAGHGECGPDCEFCYGPDGKKLENCVHDCASAN